MESTVRKYSAWVKTRPLIVMAVALGLVLVACGEQSPTSVRPDGTTTAAEHSSVSLTDDAGPSGSEGDTGASSSAQSDAVKLSLGESASADAIVAAQEAVMIRIYEKLLPSVVHIRVSTRLDQERTAPSIPRVPGFPTPDLPDDFFQRGEGSGFVWDDQGRIVTNNHVIQGADRVIVAFADRTEIDARVLGTDPDSDLAALQLEEPNENARPVVLGDSDALKVGQMAVAIGNPFGQEFTMTSGIVSALGRTIRSGNSPFSIPEVIQTDAPINPGNSGGPLLDRLGRVIGVNTQIISRSGVSAGVGFAVPVSTAKLVIPVLIKDGRFEYSWLGITGVTLSPGVAEGMELPRGTGGALVIQVSEDSPADRAGLRESNRTITLEGVQLPLGGDVIVAIEGAPISEMEDLIAYLTGRTRPGDEVTLDVIREEGERGQVVVTLGKRPSADQ